MIFVVWNLVFISSYLALKMLTKVGFTPPFYCGMVKVVPRWAWNHLGCQKPKWKSAAVLAWQQRNYTACRTVIHSACFSIFVVVEPFTEWFDATYVRISIHFRFLSNLSKVNKSLVQTLAPIPVAFVGNECCIIIRITKGPLTGEIRLTLHYDNRF